jgi:hypothetical protein
MTEERRQLGRKVRKMLHDTVPTCIAAVDHGDYVGCYVYPEHIADTEKVVQGKTWDGLRVVVRPVPPVTLGTGGPPA